MKWPFVLRSTIESERRALISEIVRLRTEMRDERATAYLTAIERAKLQAEVNQSLSRMLNDIEKNGSAVIPVPAKNQNQDWRG
jgi:hypothetical protein